MKDGSDLTTGCNNDENTHTLLHGPFNVDDICLGDSPTGSSDEDLTTNKAMPDYTSPWGDFESFNEFTPQSDQFYYADEPLGLDFVDSATSAGEDFIEKPDFQDTWDAFTVENSTCEHVFRLSFPVIPVSETNEDVKSLSTLMTSSNEEPICKLIKTRLWLDCDHSQTGGDVTCGKTGYDWQKTKSCRDLMLLIGTDVKNISVNEDDISDAVSVTDIEQFYVKESTPPADKTSLIQTKLDVAPGSKQGNIFSYQFFLKNSTDDFLPFLPFSGKKSFFSTNHFRLPNF